MSKFTDYEISIEFIATTVIVAIAAVVGATSVMVAVSVMIHVTQHLEFDAIDFIQNESTLSRKRIIFYLSIT